MQRPRYTAEDFKTVANKIRYDLTAAQAKLTDLMRMITTLDLPTEDQPYSLERAEQYVTDVGWMYTDPSLEADLRERGATNDHIPLLLALAAKRREQLQTTEAA
jgi:hypothetical protein